MSQTQPALAHPGLLGRVLDWVRARCGPPDELAALSRDELRAMSADLALCETDLLSLSASLADNSVLMERMIRARGFEPEHLQQCFGLLLRDIQRVCTTCHSTGRCRRELDAGRAAAHAHEYCPNAATFDDLLEFMTSR